MLSVSPSSLHTHTLSERIIDSQWVHVGVTFFLRGVSFWMSGLNVVRAFKDH